ncbi:DNA glycosylase AlkZ-like family protein [Saccharothrix variisporea]|uniref:Winged helix DNA-binding protein n=1 Tax=Saccharothrix variisporea TaxID=543527 RepID=A0A495XH78_9PSEU|nr:crosslink repair DNA glycosylase YcaQ family protein [Saccharothrix variisporea]RKT73821.1 winged helix DNA-binding protein [Saccharothrix variisporea]
MDVTAADVLAHRAAVQGLHDGDLGVLALGVVDSPPNTGAAAIAVRRLGYDEPLVRVLSLRGAPHLHRPSDVPGLRRVLRPRTPRQLQAWCGGMPAPELSDVDLVVELMRREFPGETATKGELSAAISPLLPKRATPYCPSCKTEHVIEGLFRLGTLLAGIELEPRGAKLVFRAPGPNDEGDSTLVSDYAHYVGPFAKADVEKWLGAGPQDTWPELRPVTVEGRKLLLGGDLVEGDELPAGLLLFPRDPYLLGPRWLVAEPDVAKRVWRPVGSPGALVTHGRVTGAWRYAFSGRTMIFRVEGWSRVEGAARKAIKDQADVLAGVWGADVLEATVVEW